ncbi:DNA polymerase III subunit beta [Salipaludibacillus keqinensis]|uniref:Beta sliding clamp n=1 Tax=Salipaludibacillus keqinensis TaxID=2045207 RepID=A0A323T6C4_9BACI|nr:DNA polymerase III subunit beta [Salipaludibacillus keqinensis]PYZ91802.1 DNA polymerase III subunit beta [Salipaludibacillus keqinensis]
MKFTIQRDRFVQSVQHVSKAISSRTTIPILTGIKIEASEEGVTLTGSDSDISIESFIPTEDGDHQLVELEQEGSIVLQARFFGDIVKKLPEDTIEIMVSNQFVTQLKSGSSVFNLNGLDPEEYPRLPEIAEENVFKMPKDLLKSIIRQTAFAVSTVETRPILTGIHWSLEDGHLTCTATDSHRLAMRHAQVETNTSDLEFSNVVIPGKSLNELNKILDDTDEWIDIIVTDNQILFKATNLLFFSRLLDGNYPATKNMIPTQSKTTVKLKAKNLLDAIERALLLSREGKNNVVNVKTIENNELEITSVTPEVGKVTEDVQSLDYTGDELRISFNGKNVIDALKVIESTEVEINFTGAMSPFVMKPAERDHMLHLFSPVRTY